MAKVNAPPADGWKPIKSAPFRQVVWIKNEQMEHPCLATRGYVHNGMVHPDSEFFTTVFTPDPDGLFPTPSGQLACPTVWAPQIDEREDHE